LNYNDLPENPLGDILSGHEKRWGNNMRLLIALIVGLTSTIAIALEPIMASAREKTELPLRECLSKAQAAMRGTGLTYKFKVDGNTVSGEFDEKSDYMGYIKCKMEEKAVIYIVAGLAAERTNSIMKSMREGFNK